MSGEIVISGTEHDLVNIMIRAKLIEDLLKEHGFSYERAFVYDGCQEIEYKERRIYNQAGEFIKYTVHATPAQVNFIWHLYCTIYSEMMYIALCLNKPDAPEKKPKRRRKKKST